MGESTETVLAVRDRMAELKDRMQQTAPDPTEVSEYNALLELEATLMAQE